MNKSALLKTDNLILLSISIFKFITLLIFAGNYGIFRDELYYLQCADHLAFGYVDQPPLSALILFISTGLFGNSLLAIRIFAYIASCGTVFMAGIITRELGGGRYAQIAAAVSVLFCGVVLGGGSYFSMNVFDILLTTITFYYIIKLVKTGNQKLWLTIGVLFGLGLQNKLSFLFLGAGLLIGLLLTGRRKDLISRELWIGAGIAFLISLPNIIWQIVNNYPTLEFMQNASMYKNRHMGFIEFTLNLIMELNPFNTVFLVAALYFLFFNKSGKKFILLGIMFITIYLVFIFNNGKPYYMGILYPMMLAAGAAGIEFLIKRYLREWTGYVLLVLLLPGYLITAPFAIPILEADEFIDLSSKMGITHQNAENSELGMLPQFYSDRFGWKEMAKEVSEIYNSLPGKEKQNTIVFGQNYGEAGAIDYFRKDYDLPPAVSSHNNYWF